MKIWKRNAVIATVLLFICAGVYLNWSYNNRQKTPDLTDTLNAEQVMGEATLQMEDAAEPVSLDPSAGATDDYFAQMRLSRQKARDEAVELLQETIAYAEGEDTSTSNTALEGIIADALAESQIESLVVAKGYADCVAYISEDGVFLAVAAPESGLTQSDVSLVADIVLSQTNFKLSDIRVIGV